MTTMMIVMMTMLMTRKDVSQPTFILGDLAVVSQVSLVADDDDGDVGGALGLLHLPAQLAEDLEAVSAGDGVDQHAAVRPAQHVLSRPVVVVLLTSTPRTATHARTHAPARTRTHARTHTHTHTHTRTHTHTHTHTHIHTHTHTHLSLIHI